jgi:hypothetical protein
MGVRDQDVVDGPIAAVADLAEVGEAGAALLLGVDARVQDDPHAVEVDVVAACADFAGVPEGYKDHVDLRSCASV